MKTYLHSIFAVLLLVTILPLSAQSLPAPEGFESEEESTQIAWATEAFANNLMADGITTFENSGQTIRFELGTFAAGFDPLTASPSEWLTNWIVLQGEDYDLLDQQVIQTATLSSNASPFEVGAQAYIWGYNTKDLSMGAEWIVVGAADWKYPASNSPLPVTFSMSDANLSDALWGSVNPVNGNHHMQLHAVIPEPSSALLSLTALSFILLRRRRSMAAS